MNSTFSLVQRCFWAIFSEKSPHHGTMKMNESFNYFPNFFHFSTISFQPEKKTSFELVSRRVQNDYKLRSENRLKKLGTIVPTLDNSSSSKRKVNGKFHELHSDRQEAAATFLLLSIFCATSSSHMSWECERRRRLISPSLRALFLG